MAAKTWPAIKALLNTAADAGDKIHQVLFGTSSADRVFYPDNEDHFEGAKPHTRGKAIATDTTLEYLMNNGLAVFLDAHSICWATIQTNATGVAPIYLRSHGFNTGVAIVKDEPADTLLLTFDTAYADGHWLAFGQVETDEVIIHVHTRTTTVVEFEYHSLPSGNSMDINNKICGVLVIGAR